MPMGLRWLSRGSRKVGHTLSTMLTNKKVIPLSSFISIYFWKQLLKLSMIFRSPVVLKQHVGNTRHFSYRIKSPISPSPMCLHENQRWRWQWWWLLRKHNPLCILVRKGKRDRAREERAREEVAESWLLRFDCPSRAGRGGASCFLAMESPCLTIWRKWMNLEDRWRIFQKKHSGALKACSWESVPCWNLHIKSIVLIFAYSLHFIVFLKKSVEIFFPCTLSCENHLSSIRQLLKHNTLKCILPHLLVRPYHW